MTEIEQSLRVTNIICAAVLSSLFVYAGVAWFVSGQGNVPPVAVEPTLGVLTWALLGVGVSMLLVAEVAFRVLSQGARHKKEVSQRFAQHRIATIAAFALRESTAIIGLVAFFVTGKVTLCYSLCGLAALAMIAGWPRRSQLEELATPRPSPGR
jgi:hypothetical protein